MYDYNNFDFLSLYVKKDKKEEILKYYRTFKWDLKEEKPNRRYADIVDLVLFRPHLMQNKDELQLLQVYMEEGLNKKAKLEHNKYFKATTLGVGLSLLGIVLIVISLIFNFNLEGLFNLFLTILFAFVGVCLIIICISILPTIIKKEKELFKQNVEMVENQLSLICIRVSEIVEE